MARHNFSSFVVKDFDLEQMNFGRLGLLIINGFSNVNEINHYLKVMNSSAQLELPPQVRPVVISVDNFDTLLRGGGSFDEYFRYMRDKTYEDTQERVLPSEFFEHEPPGVAPEGYEDGDIPAEGDGLPGQEITTEPEVSAMPDEPELSPASPVAEPAKPEQVKPEPAKPEQVKPEPAKPEPAVPVTAAPKPAPAPPALPDYPEGSEGDDPLLD